MNYYNEFDPHAAAWLRELISAGHIPPGEIDTRSIADVQPNDLKPFTQCHFFAGIAGWPYALALAGVDPARPLWTGSCPCQPFSVAGKGLGTADERHLWPVFANLIRECRPATVFGEQVASRAGREWLAGVFADLEGMGYAVAGADLCAAGVGAPHIRQRLYWVANTAGKRHARERILLRQDEAGRDAPSVSQAARGGSTCGGPTPDTNQRRGAQHPDKRRAGAFRDIAGCGHACGLGDAIKPGLEEFAGYEHNGHEPGREPEDAPRPTSTASGAWDSFDLLHCTDAKTRRIESGTFPLAHGVPGRVGLLRGYGNAIVPQVAASFVKAALKS